MQTQQNHSITSVRMSLVRRLENLNHQFETISKQAERLRLLSETLACEKNH